MDIMNLDNKIKSVYGLQALNKTYLLDDILPISNNTINIGSNINNFNNVYSYSVNSTNLNSTNLVANNIYTSNFNLNGNFNYISNPVVTLHLVGLSSPITQSKLIKIGNLILYEANLPSILNNSGTTQTGLNIPYTTQLPAPAINTVTFVSLNDSVNNKNCYCVSVNSSGYFNFNFDGGQISVANGGTLAFNTPLKLMYTI